MCHLAQRWPLAPQNPPGCSLPWVRLPAAGALCRIPGWARSPTRICIFSIPDTGEMVTVFTAGQGGRRPVSGRAWLAILSPERPAPEIGWSDERTLLTYSPYKRIYPYTQSLWQPIRILPARTGLRLRNHGRSPWQEAVLLTPPHPTAVLLAIYQIRLFLDDGCLTADRAAYCRPGVDDSYTPKPSIGYTGLVSWVGAGFEKFLFTEPTGISSG